jgi:hypothetical protein
MDHPERLAHKRFEALQGGSQGSLRGGRRSWPHRRARVWPLRLREAVGGQRHYRSMSGSGLPLGGQATVEGLARVEAASGTMVPSRRGGGARRQRPTARSDPAVGEAQSLKSSEIALSDGDSAQVLEVWCHPNRQQRGRGSLRPPSKLLQWLWQHGPLLPHRRPRRTARAIARPSSYSGSGQTEGSTSGTFFACGIARRNDWLR